MTTAESKQRELAALIGEEHFKVVDPTSIHAMEMGVVVDIHIRRWRGRTQLDFADLGLERLPEDREYAHLLRLGDKKLLPKTVVDGRETSYVDVLDSIEGRARRWLESNSFQTHWGRFVPHTLYAKWKQGNETISKEYLGLRDEITEKYPEIVERLLREYESMARTSYRRAAALKPQLVDEDVFTKRFMEHIRSLVPTADRIYDSFGYDIEVSFVPLPSDFEKEVARAERIRRAEDLRAEADRAKLSSIRNMNDDVIRQVRDRKMTVVDDFMRDIARQIRALVYEAVTDVLDSIRRNGKVIGKASAQLSSLVASIEALNFYGDRDIDAVLRTVKNQLDVPSKDRSTVEIIGLLSEIGTLTRAGLIALGDTPRSARDLGIPDEPLEGMVRSVRENLGIVPVTETLGERAERPAFPITSAAWTPEG